ncbi:glycosyltransferase family 2 protein [Patescibacteria group bacterium]|nr:glycosyltransferase family 2 protein [Patescibacteria group bacterium]
MKLSLCIATYNEEKNIHYALDSSYDLADEVIVVDGGSTDDTVKIAKSYGKKVRIINSDNPSMFHINKQKAIEAARGEWILQLDADEELSDELKEEIKKVVDIGSSFHPTVLGKQREAGKIASVQSGPANSRHSSQDQVPNAYWIPRRNWFLTKFLMKGGQYPDYTIRLYRNGVAKFPCKDVHENVEINGEVGYLKSPLNHYADPDFSRYLMRWDRYTTLEVQSLKFKVKNENKNSFLMFLEYFFWKPFITFFGMYFRHKGFMDGFPGFVFALFSSIRFWVIYIKWVMRRRNSN